MIALIITIIVMLILVGVTVTSAINGGLFKKSKEAARETENAKIFEQIQLAVVASKKFENEMPYEEVLNLLDAKRDSDDYDEQTYNLAKNFFELMQENKPIHAYFRLIGLDSNIMQNIDGHLDKGEVLEAYCILTGGTKEELMQMLEEEEGITTEEEAKKYITDMLTQEANSAKQNLVSDLYEWKTNDLNRTKLLKELEPIIKDNKEIKKEELGTNIIKKDGDYVYNNSWAIVLKYGGVKVTILGTGEIIGPEKEISKAIEDPKEGDITDEGIRSGLEYNPYLIASIEDLVAFSKSVNEGNTYEGKYIELAIDLDFKDSNSYKNANSTQFEDLNGDGTVKGIQEELTDENGKGFTPIGVGNEGSQKSFNGTFNGNYHKIKNIYINNSENDYLALFAKAQGAIIENLGLERGKIINSSNSNYNYVAGIIGGTYIGMDGKHKIKDTIIKNCFVDLDEIKGVAKKTTTAGVAIDVDEMIGCYNKTNITSNYQSSGLADCAWTLINSYNIGNISALENEHSDGDVDIEACGLTRCSYYNYNCYNSGNLMTKDDIGEAIGARSEKVMENVYNFGNINARRGVGLWTDKGEQIVNYGQVYGKVNTAGMIGKNINSSNSGYIKGNVYVNGVQIDDEYAKTEEEINSILKPVLEVINTSIKGKVKGNAFVADTNNINNGLPILKWQVEH